jgi:hypothetical protein
MKQLIFIALGIILLAQYSCKKVQPEMKELDCSCAKEVSADFTMEEIVAGSFPEDGVENFWTFTDTIYSEKTVRFTALEDGATYKWYMGSEIVNQKQLKRYFSTAFSNQVLPITLVVKKKPNKICFPNDDGFDSITKFLYIKRGPLLDTTFLEGIFRFYSEELKDSFDVKIDFEPGGISDGPFFNMYNYDGLGSNSINQLKWFANYLEAFGLIQTSIDASPSARIKSDINRRITLSLYYGLLTNEKKFFGRKL